MSKTRQLAVNGQSLELDIDTHDTEMSKMVAHLDSWCLSEEQRSFDATRNYDSGKRQKMPFSWVSHTGNQFTVGCFKTRAKHALDFIRRFDMALYYGDLSYLGTFYYYKVNPYKSGTRTIRIQNGEGFNLNQLFSKQGDVPGRDLPGLPRPLESLRIFSFGEIGEPGASVVYECKEENLNELLNYYHTMFFEHGFKIVAEESFKNGQHDLVIEKDRMLYAVVLWQGKESMFSALSVVSGGGHNE